jgi:tyrosinase
LRVRRDVQSLIVEGDAGLQLLDAYARAVTSMRQLDPGPDPPSDPRSWRFQAAIHGFPGLPSTVSHPLHWASCRHNSWFFLPWHRLYLFCFERIVQSHLDDDTWSLPYWDYTKVGASSARVLPAPFRVPATGNPLRVEQRDRARNDPVAPLPLESEDVDAMQALRLRDFSLPPENAAASFGGGVVQDVLPMTLGRGSLELTPHGLVHGAIGGMNPPGLMSRFATAGLDPIFWLHHANIDRLWDVWIAHWGADALPADDTWLDTEFEFFDRDGSTTLKRKIRDLLDSAELGYEYESTEPPQPIPELPGPMGLRLAFPEEVEADMTEPDLLGAAEDVPFAARADVGIDLAGAPERLREAAALTEPTRWFLRVEDVVGDQPGAPRYDVYLNVPEGHDAASIPSFAPAASRASASTRQVSRTPRRAGSG